MFKAIQTQTNHTRLQNLPAFAGFEAPATRRDDTVVAVCTRTERLLGYSSLSSLLDEREEDTMHRAVVDGTAVKATVLADNSDAPMSSIISLFIILIG